MKRVGIIIPFILALALSSCEKGYFVSTMNNPADSTVIHNADTSFVTELTALWEGINNSYVMWQYDTLDWDAYRPRLIALGEKLDAEARRDTATFNAKWCKNVADGPKSQITILFKNFLDHHMVIQVVNPYIPLDERKTRSGATLNISPGAIRVAARNGYHKSLKMEAYKKALKVTDIKHSDIVEAKFVDKNGSSTELYTTVFKDCIPYLHMDGYVITDIVNDNYEAQSGQYESKVVLYTFFDNIKTLQASGELKGIILDNRDNSGGHLDDLDFIVGAFLDDNDNITIARSRFKYGLGKYDIYPSWSNTVITSLNSTDHSDYIKKRFYVGRLGNVPYVVLQNCYSISMGEMAGAAVLALSQYDNLTERRRLIGETTFGATGSLVFASYEDNNYNGSFNAFPGMEDTRYHGLYTVNYLEEVYDFRTSQFEFIEGKGINPDVTVDAWFNLLAKGIFDNQLYEAVKFIAPAE